MAKWIQPGRVRVAISNLASWRETAKAQGAMHLWPLLALVEKGANPSSFIKFDESDDFAFWDRYGRLPGENRKRGDSESGFTADYYIDPLVKLKKPSDYPHRSPYTIRKRTFLNSWKAAELNPNDQNQWRLAEDFANHFQRRALTRAGTPVRIPVVDLAVWLFRYDEFDDDATAKTLEAKFRSTFAFEDSNYYALFEFVNESAEYIFTSARPTDEAYVTAINESLELDYRRTRRPPLLYSASPDSPALDEDDPIFVQVKDILAIGTSGIIFRGCPGTSKTWYAKQIAQRLALRPDHIFQVQFHPSYGYEDFVEGYKPDEASKSGFRIVNKVFLDACGVARRSKGQVVFIIDEINRGDPSRILGELLTYIEFGYRGEKFRRAYSGRPTSVPVNLLILGTMNQHDRSITQLDQAFLRRFDHIDLEPQAETVEMFLQQSGQFTPAQVNVVSRWFESLQNLIKIGHTYFKDVSRPEHFRLIWQYRILPYCETVLELDPQKLENVKNLFEATYKSLMVENQDGDGD